MRINESALRQYVVGFRGAKPAVLWFDIKNFKEVAGKTTKTISFDEDGITYTYNGSDTTGYTEASNKSPFITRYEVLDEAELEARGYIDIFDNVLSDEEEADINVIDEFEYDNSDYDLDAWSRNCGGSHGCGGGYRHYGCGGYGGCGGGGGC